MFALTTLPVKKYRVYDAWEKETLLETTDYDEADGALNMWRKKRQQNEIELLALVSS